ncbi:hypothetical protein GRI72_02920 [Altererythrobacter marinus]|uniref:Uncharacterized protein n=1 Tax=Pelagerythrobacter marinus TaxID=538382 RepID=A0ABW9UVD4_9SPHN|nr:hypothetical protein [Pelagerythrobacter marinus]MXO67785.1 hypothetical protein [Pelagerythrobacter marinus]
MSNWELIDFNPDTGLRKYVGDHPDDPDGVLVRYEQSAKSIDAIIERNKRAQIDSQGKRLGSLEKVAEIPVGVMYEWLVKFGVDAWNPDHSDAVKKLLNDPDYRYLKCKNIIL